ncbi:Fe-S cluster assembly protein SufD [Treponema pedis]|uniref:Fe-S cluster assembly protein SufD n=1 Tax=Treponema pedis TaxID=409322 RepID=A0A7S6WRC2_9SPIR|nr:Fe-S cluster assembly protein SufD [Treponema pedis]QOW61885.1 Fe-S cluster assembly protein SufD [Treponema pedis]
MNKTYFKRLDYAKEDIPAKEFTNLVFSGKGNNIEYMPIENFLASASPDAVKKIFDFTKSVREKNCGLGEIYIQEVKDKRNSGVYIKVKKAKTEEETANLFVNFNMDEKNNVLYDQSFIHIEEGSKAKIFLYYDVAGYDCSRAELFRNGLLSIIAEKDSVVELIKVQNLSHCGINFETVKLYALEHAEVRFYDIQLGGKINGSSTSTYMPEQWADVQIFPLYFADKNRKIDLEQNFIINGKNSSGSISARGALKNTAHKMFRGNIFLNKGCSHSSAKFSDNTIMLDKTTVGATIPTIFCDEDDVIGEHAASFEAVNRDKLYYLMTRGFDELSAKKLIIEAAFKPVFGMIDDEEIKERLLNEFRVNLDEITE